MSVRDVNQFIENNQVISRNGNLMHQQGDFIKKELDFIKVMARHPVKDRYGQSVKSLSPAKLPAIKTKEEDDLAFLEELPKYTTPRERVMKKRQMVALKADQYKRLKKELKEKKRQPVRKNSK